MIRSIGFILLVFLVCVFSCAEKNDFLQEEETVSYKGYKKLQFENLIYAAQMKGDFRSDTLMVRVETENVGDKPIELFFTRAELMGQNGVRSKVVRVSKPSIVLEPGESTIDTVYFRPIDHMELYKHTDLHGEFGESYFFIPGAIGSMMFSSKGIKLIADEGRYSEYQSLGLYDEVQVYDIDGSAPFKDSLYANMENLYNFLRAQSKDMRDIPKPGVQIAKKELMAGGFGMLSKAYLYNNKLQVIWRMVNHQGQTVFFDPAKFEVQANGKTYRPTKLRYIDKPATWKNENTALKKGERVGVHLEFEKVDADQIIFSPSVTYGEGDTLIKSIPLKKVSWTSQGQE